MRRLLLVHAHPDDETLTTGGTIAHYVAMGAEVSVLTCTLGEEGEVIGPRWAGLAAGQADQLGGYRIGELSAALTALGVPGGPRYLGGAGRWRDSGMAGTAAAGHPRSFAAAGPEAVRELVAEIRALRPQVVVAYDPAGGYGHPDHVAVHRVTTEAVRLAGQAQTYPETGPAWGVAKLYWTVTERTALQAGLAAMPDPPEGWRRPDDGELPSVPDEQVQAVIDVSPVLPAKLAALRAHATQVSVGPDGCCYALSNNVAQPILTAEHYILAHGRAGELGADGREHDLFAGLAS